MEMITLKSIVNIGKFKYIFLNFQNLFLSRKWVIKSEYVIKQIFHCRHIKSMSAEPKRKKCNTRHCKSLIY